jgi:hypothetical protein
VDGKIRVKFRSQEIVRAIQSENKINDGRWHEVGSAFLRCATEGPHANLFLDTTDQGPTLCEITGERRFAES